MAGEPGMRTGGTPEISDEPPAVKTGAGRKLCLIILWLFGITIYLNLGWTVITYMDNHVTTNCIRDGTLTEKILQGPHGLLDAKRSCGDYSLKNKSLVKIAVLTVWPIHAAIPIIFWLLYSGYVLVYAVGWAAYKLLWLVFAGGVVKLLGWV